MSAVSTLTDSVARPIKGIVRERLERTKRESVESALGKGESWVTKLLNNGSGICVDDLPLLLDFLGLKVVDKSKVCVDPEIAHAYDVIVRKKLESHSLLYDDAE